MYNDMNKLLERLKNAIETATKDAQAFEQSKQVLIKAISTQFGPVNQSNAHGCTVTVAHLLTVDDPNAAVIAAQEELLVNAALLSDTITSLQSANCETLQILRPYQAKPVKELQNSPSEALAVAALHILKERGQRLFLSLNSKYPGTISDAGEHSGDTIKRLRGTDE